MKRHPLNRIIVLSCLGLLLAGCSSHSWVETAQPQPKDVANMLASNTPVKQEVAISANEFELPSSVRPCCAFGNEQHVEVGKVKVPFFQLPNTADIDNIGPHIYGSSQFSMRDNDTTGSLQGEHNGVLYTLKGGFIDLAHVRDTADNTTGLFYKIYPKLGQEFSIELEPELGARTIHFKAFDVSGLSEADKKKLSIELAAYYAFKMAQGHEISQWHEFKSFPLFPELVSAYSLEDLYSNMLGAKLASKLLMDGLAQSVDDYNRNMSAWLYQTLQYLQALDVTLSSQAFDAVDGQWWDSNTPIPEKYMILKRNYNLTMQQTPLLIREANLTKATDSALKEHINDGIEPLVLTLAEQDFDIVFDEISNMTMAIDEKYRETFTSHIPQTLYPDFVLDTRVYNQIAQYDQEFDSKEYQAILKERDKE
ncbi:DUF4056 domain-containing protein [Vibrio gangliei]|uniref:DUF4056 domain-containing protein n=1 Tax=Vibrio gangliei TaxID=2077090 RepID=UPI0013005337|nr:DUF4056 domain-containing protein [Vibrio gangliei]